MERGEKTHLSETRTRTSLRVRWLARQGCRRSSPLARRASGQRSSSTSSWLATLHLHLLLAGARAMLLLAGTWAALLVLQLAGARATLLLHLLLAGAR